ncbi:flagellar biosynthetic protein FliR [Caulobacter sp. CCUG 60055]|uniref:flagellar biosynthetic protein FliR n=1 Tax=Caulobacter sp. CCUG 60055 TaxID=2100090 RepID=UPI001FA6DFBE|nr:flagellar biosynthetic protein FliR [Caulobacter sp. CCUG 60055]MBQ1542085.1 flagellar type III secretion system protein FliR [Caulobacteraceae bacterium]MCI3180202.1 flagellar biosynthetic protein FliR [Caulobacter sp. CCUG 60055]
MESYATAQQVFAAGLVFARVGALVMVIPGLGEASVPARVRLSFALLLALCLGPIAAPTLPAIPEGLGGMVGLIIKEALIGLIIGTVLRMFLGSLAVAGELVSLQTQLSFAQTANPLQAQPGTTIASFLSLLGVTLVFATGLHREFIAAIAHSYTLFAPGKALPIADAGALAVQTMGKSFALGVQLAAPVIVFALVFNIATGLIGRVMPQFQVFFVATPLSLLFGLSIFALSLGVIGMVWVDRYKALLQLFV